jgi:hypothetical protein
VAAGFYANEDHHDTAGSFGAPVAVRFVHWLCGGFVPSFASFDRGLRNRSVVCTHACGSCYSLRSTTKAATGSAWAVDESMTTLMGGSTPLPDTITRKKDGWPINSVS